MTDINLNTEMNANSLYEPLEANPVEILRFLKPTPALKPLEEIKEDLSNFPDRVISEDEVKLFNISAKIYKLSENAAACRAVVFKNSIPVEVLDDCGRILGYATIYQEKNFIIADARIDYHSPERLSIQNKVPFTLIPFGEIAYDQKVADLVIESVNVQKLILDDGPRAHKELWLVQAA